MKMQQYLPFALLAVTHALAAVYAPIQDCDEVFNYWEAAHYLVHGYGLQTWELSPAYSIRSWLYIVLHAIPIKLLSLVAPSIPKSTQFLNMRLLLGVAMAGAEYKLFARLRAVFSPMAAICYLLWSAISTGSFIAAPSFLPNSFVMFCTTMALASCMKFKARGNLVNGVTWLAVGTVIGWPFAGLLSLPFVAVEVFRFFPLGANRVQNLARLALQSLVILTAEVAIDSSFARRLHSVPFNITRYNVFPGEGQGPDIYGTEPWTFYPLNLALNFNLIMVLAVLAPLFVCLTRARNFGELTHILMLLAPFCIWVGTLSLPAHKEERFMYPAYPCLLINAAISLHILDSLPTKEPEQQSKGFQQGGWAFGRFGFAIIGVNAKYFKFFIDSLIYSTLLLSTMLSIWRSAGLATAYNAPFDVYSRIPTNRTYDTNLCVGKEWYRFPSSFFLPSHRTLANGSISGVTRLKFIRSSFHGLLPGEFHESRENDGLGWRPGTWLIPPRMNDKNQEDPSKHTDLSQCDFLVDSRLPSWSPNSEEPDYIGQAKSTEGDFRIMYCAPFLDAASTGLLGRLGWAPASMRVWGDYCLLERASDDLGHR